MENKSDLVKTFGLFICSCCWFVSLHLNNLLENIYHNRKVNKFDEWSDEVQGFL